VTTINQEPAVPIVDADPIGDRWLRWAATFFAVAVLFHNGDHARRGADSVSADLFWVGLLGILVEVGIVVFVFLGHRLSALAATSTGFGLAVAYVVVHVLPERGWLSDPLLESGSANVSRAAAILLIVAALTLGMVSAVVLRRRGGLAAATVGSGPSRPLAGVLAHPVVVAMIAGNAVLIAMSLADLSQ
jgi:hypothetical protein